MAKKQQIHEGNLAHPLYNERKLKNSELPKIRIDSELHAKMLRCLDAIKTGSDIEISMSALRRMAYRDFVEKVLSRGLTIQFIPK